MFDQGCGACLFTKVDTDKLNEKRKLLDTFINRNGRMILYDASVKDTGIFSSFWKYMCGGPDPYNSFPRVFNWAECVN